MKKLPAAELLIPSLAFPQSWSCKPIRRVTQKIQAAQFLKAEQ